MRKADLFDEIIFCMKELSEREPTAEISPELLDKLMNDLPPQTDVPLYEPTARKTPVTQPVSNTPVIVNAPVKEISVPLTPRPAAPAAPAASFAPDCTWEELHAAANACQKCGLCQTRTNVVFGDGNPHAE